MLSQGLENSMQNYRQLCGQFACQIDSSEGLLQQHQCHYVTVMPILNHIDAVRTAGKVQNPKFTPNVPFTLHATNTMYKSSCKQVILPNVCHVLLMQHGRPCINKKHT